MGRILYFVTGLMVGKFIALNMESRELKSGVQAVGDVKVNYSVHLPTGWKKEANYHETSSVTWKV